MLFSMVLEIGAEVSLTSGSLVLGLYKASSASLVLVVAIEAMFEVVFDVSFTSS